MMEKALIVEELGAGQLLLPERVNRALAANERVKYALSLLQAAKLRADNPHAPFSDLRTERKASHVSDLWLDTVVQGSRRANGGAYYVPGSTRIHDCIMDDVEEMIAPLELSDGPGGAEPYRKRLDRLRATASPIDGDVLTQAHVDAMTHARRDRGDSIHLLVMDLHKELHRLQSAVAQETVEGARVYGITLDDRPLITAFMHGLNATAPLKFDHPGLGTTATRMGDELVIENDIGATDAHVLVVAIAGLTARATYTDVHRRRAEFFRNLFACFAVEWENEQARTSALLPESHSYVLSVGRFTGRDRQELERYLYFLGSRLVFLIDWNRARKRLRRFLKKQDCVEVLTWATENDCGHRAWLELGGEQLVFDAIRRVAGPEVRYGERLDDLLGREAAVAALKQVLRIAAEGLLQHRSERRIRDEVEAELLRYFQTTQEEVFGAVTAHAALVAELAAGVRDGLLRGGTTGARAFRQRTAGRAKIWEQKADRLLVRARSGARQSPRADVVTQVLGEADDAADCLEETAFYATLLPSGDQAVPDGLARLAGLTFQAAQEYVKAVETVAAAHRGNDREDVQDFLEAVDRIGSLEHETDEAERTVTAELLEGAADCRQLHLISTVAGRLEEATDSLARTVLTLRDYVLSAS